MAHDILPVVDVATEAANDLRGVTFAADGKIYVSGHKGDVETETATVVGRFNADGTPDAAFGEDGFVEVDLAPGRVEQSLAVAELSGGDVVAVVNAVDEDGGQSVYLLRFDSSGTRKTGADWGGDGGAVEVVFGWANADNDSFPGVEAPPRTPPGTCWSTRPRRRGEARGRGLRRRGRRHRPHRQRPLRRAASRRRRQPRSGLQRRRALHLPLGADLRRRRAARRRRSRRLDHERRLHQPRRDAEEPRHPDPAQPRRHARRELRRLRRARLLRRGRRADRDARRRRLQPLRRPMAASPSAMPPRRSRTAAT